MRMKDVCARTGLTDRAVRLYIENGLLQPNEEINYAGRRTIHFSEDDVSTLEAITTLRKADFSIVDIREMQKTPSNIHSILDLHRHKIAEDIENKQQILQKLSSINVTEPLNYTEIAKSLRESASRNNLPKEDSRMNFKDFQQIIKNRSYSVIAFAMLLIGIITLTPIFLKTAFADEKIATGGGYDITYTFTWEHFLENILLFGAYICMIAAAILLFSHIVCGKRNILIVANMLCILFIAIILFLPDNISQNLYRYEFFSYRQSFMWHLLYNASASFDIFIKCLKYIPATTAVILTIIGIIKHKEIKSEIDT